MDAIVQQTLKDLDERVFYLESLAHPEDEGPLTEAQQIINNHLTKTLHALTSEWVID